MNDTFCENIDFQGCLFFSLFSGTEMIIVIMFLDDAQRQRKFGCSHIQIREKRCRTDTKSVRQKRTNVVRDDQDRKKYT